MQSSARRRDLTEGPIVKTILLFIIPVIIGNIFTQLYNVVDSAVVGRFVSSSALAAVGSCYTIQMLINTVIMGLGTGAMTVTSHYFGAKRSEDVAKTVTTTFFLAVILGAILTVVGLFVSRPLLNLVGTPGSIIDDAVLYLRVVFIGTMGQILYTLGSSVLRGIGDTVFPLVMLIISALVNVVLDLVFVVNLHMGVAGVAWATVIAQVLSAVLIIIRVMSGKYGFKITKEIAKINGEIAKIIAKIGVPSVIQGMASSVGLMIVQSFINRFGENVIAANTTVQKFDGFAVLLIMAINVGVSAFVGQNLGAQKLDRVKKVIPTFGAISFVYGVVLGVLIWFFGENIIRIFTTNEQVIEIGITAMRIVAFVHCAKAPYNVIVGMLRGAGATTAAMVIAFITIGIQIPLAYFLAVRTGDFRGLYYTTVIIAVLDLVMGVIYYFSGRWKNKSVIDRKEQMRDMDVKKRDERNIAIEASE